MDRDEEEELAQCVDCGAEISPSRDRGFAIGEEAYLCFGCALRRGGSYDYAQEQWVLEPNVEDEPDERRPHP